MLPGQLLSVLLYLSGVLMSVAAALAIVRPRRGMRHVGSQSDAGAHEDDIVFHLRGRHVIHANFDGRRRLDRISDLTDDHARLRRLLSLDFDEHDKLVASNDEFGDLSAISRDQRLQAVREVAGDEVRLRVASRHCEAPNARDVHILDAAADELQTLRGMVQHTPFHLWRENRQGEVVWANQNYLNEVTQVMGAKRASVWPIPALFPGLRSTHATDGKALRRIRLASAKDDENGWYDCHVTDVDGDRLCTAFRADEAVRSEARRREFTQTLTKTFADLSIGLAIFDRSRRLALFNPALTDLTSLPVDFLSSRPNLVGFLDQLRENRVMPEPRDYRTWRKSISDIETSAMNGTYSDTWSLPDGRTYKIAGRPHPDGAMAFLLEDITAEMSLTRRFRAQLEQSQSVIDALDDAVAIFTNSGELAFSNNAYKALWNHPSEETVLGTTVVEATRHWHKMTVPTPIWGDFRDFVQQRRERAEWTARVATLDGRLLSCRFVPQRAGATLAIFSVVAPSASSPRDLRQVV